VPDTYEANEHPHIEVPSYYWDTDGNKVTETIGWSRVRYTGYSFLAVDVEPAHAGRTTTLTVRAVAENGSKIDRFTLKRMAGQVNQSARGVETAVPDLTAS